MNLIVRLAVVALITIFSTPLLAQYSGLINKDDAKRAGLAIDWTSQIQVDGTYGKIAGMFLFVSDKASTTTFELEYDGHREVVSQYQYGPDGKMFGIDGAKEFATMKQEFLKEGQNIDAKVTKVVTPKTVLYVSTNQGIVQAIDGSSGKTLWAATVGLMNSKTSSPTANEKYVAVINGSNLFCLQADTGNVIWQEQTSGAVGGDPAISEDFIFTPLINGHVQAFPLFVKETPKEVRARTRAAKPDYQKSDKELKIEKAIHTLRTKQYNRFPKPFSRHKSVKQFVSVGAATSRPVVTGLTTSWPTLRGHYNVGFNSRDRLGKMSFRLKTGGRIIASGSVADQILYVGSTDGFVYAVDERDGQLLWDFGAGEPIGQTPVPIGDSVYAISEDFGLFKINKENGVNDPKWPSRIADIKRFVAASKDYLYVIDRLDRLVVIQQATGAKIVSIRTGGQDISLYNLKSDRLYVGTTQGTIQCLRETNSNNPYFHGASKDEEKSGGDVEKPDVTDPTKPAGEEVDPFKKKDEGKGDEKTGDEVDPFKKKDDKKDDSGGGEIDPFKKKDEGGDGSFRF
jgi:hypothetical protein